MKNKLLTVYAELFIIYGKLFTSKQQAYLNDYFVNDLSLSEIATKHQVSTMAISDSINQCKKKLDEYEQKLQLQKKSLLRRKIYNKLSSKSIKKQLLDIENN